MNGNALKTILSADGTKRVVIFRRDDGTFGFEDQHWSADEREQNWIPAGRYSVSRTESAEGALREALERVHWLSEDRTASDEYRLNALDVGAAPKAIGSLPVVCFSFLDKRHHPTGKTQHDVAGEALSLPAALAICQESESSFYLYYCDAEWNPMTDTWHPSLMAAKEQAEFEVEGVRQTWEHAGAA